MVDTTSVIRVLCTVHDGTLTYSYPGQEDDQYGRRLTGHTNAVAEELYNVHGFSDVRYGRHIHDEAFGRPFLADDGARLRAEKLAERVTLCRAWVAECARADADRAGDVSITLDTPAAIALARDAGRQVCVRRPDGSVVDL